MVAAPVEVLVCVGGFPIKRCHKGVVWSWGTKDVQDKCGTIIFGIFCVELDMGVTTFSLLDDESIIHMPKPESG